VLTWQEKDSAGNHDDRDDDEDEAEELSAWIAH
jgi:hypothetical protein